MAEVAIIGGTGLTSLKGLEITRREVIHTPYGEPSGPLTHGVLNGKEVIFLARHGYGHTIPPHKINYTANIWALHNTGVKKVIAVAAVGGIRYDMTPGKLVIPDQVIDYTWSRRSTFFEDSLTHVTHVDFTYPYSEEIRQLLIAGCRAAKLDYCDEGTYAATQGPRLETAAEINRLERDGCTIVGMTGMPEAALAREIGLAYAACSVVVNKAAGRGEGLITMEEIEDTIKTGMERVRMLLEHVVPTI
jgi:5'-methylthioinosine phosphorylase